MIIIRFLRTTPYEYFKTFLNSLDEEYDHWSLDLQSYKNDKEWFYKNAMPIDAIMTVDTDTNKIVGLCNSYTSPNHDAMAMISFVVKKEYQSKGIGTKMLLTIENVMRLATTEYIAAKHFKDNIASHKAFLKAGYEKWPHSKKYYLCDGTLFKLDPIADKAMDWKIKNIFN
jgi:RimJ/RimL family protein N-acetyltransferase